MLIFIKEIDNYILEKILQQWTREQVRIRKFSLSVAMNSKSTQSGCWIALWRWPAGGKNGSMSSKTASGFFACWNRVLVDARLSVDHPLTDTFLHEFG